MATACIPYQPVTQQTNVQAVTLYHPTDIPHAKLPPEEALRLEIEKLCTATLTIGEAFSNIGTKLSGISNAAALTLRKASKNTGVRPPVPDESEKQDPFTNLHNTCCTLETKWKEHHRAYIKLVWDSRKVAGKAEAAVDDFGKIVLPSLRDQTKTPEQKERLIQEQIRLMQRTAQPSEDICQEFSDFSETLDTYIKEFSHAVEGLEIDEQDQKVNKLKGDLNSAKIAMNSASQNVKNLGWEFAKRVVPVVGVAALLAFVTPSLFAGLIPIGGAMIDVLTIDYLQIKDSGGKLFDAWRQYRLSVADHKKIQAEYELEDTCLGQMQNLKSVLQDAGPLVQEVTMKLGIFAGVWAVITADIRKLENSLHLAEDLSSELFIRRIENLEKMYGYLSQALHHYQVTVRLPK